MNKLILVAVAATAASGIAAAPAFAGLSHNPSFSHQLPVRVPSGAQTVQVDDHHHRSDGKLAVAVSPSTEASRGPEAEPSDDHGGLRSQGTDGRVASQPSAPATAQSEPEPGDDKGGATTPVTTPTTRQAEKGDDRGGVSGGSGSGRGSSGHDG
jgi:hypothetical protein